MSDPFDQYSDNLDSPITNAAVIIPNDDENLEDFTRTIYVAVGGDLRVTMARGQVVSFPLLPAGWHPMRVAKVWATGTTADGIVGGW